MHIPTTPESDKIYKAKSKQTKPTPTPPKSPSPTDPSSPVSSPEASQQNKSTQKDPKTAKTPETFESYYLRRVTAAFADDIDKVRAAPDFTSKSIPILIQALKQGAHSFSPEEQERVMNAVNERQSGK